jgi:Icc-related predicted phosphoesterase
VLLTHGPPAGILDTTLGGQQVGCADLREAVLKIRPKLHVFGHIHEAYGIQEQDGIRFINASSCNLRYQPVQPPIVVEV